MGGKLSANLLSLDNTSHNAPLIVAQIKKRIPMAQKHLEKIRDLFQRYDTDKDDSLNLNELALLLQEISSKISPLPAVSLPSCILLLFSLLNERTDCTSRISTREVPREQAQQNLHARRDVLAANGIPATDEAVAKPFKYTHLGSLRTLATPLSSTLGINLSWAA